MALRKSNRSRALKRALLLLRRSPLLRCRQAGLQRPRVTQQERACRIRTTATPISQCALSASRLDFSKIPTSIQIPEPHRGPAPLAMSASCRWTSCLKNARTTVSSLCSRQRFPHHRLPQRFRARVCRLLHRQLGVQVRLPQGSQPPAHGLHQLRPHGHHRPLPPGRRALQILRNL